jgi:CRP-like cAMP-binding protein
MAAPELLKRCELFKGFTDTGLQIIGAVAAERQFPKGTPLFVEGMIGESLFILVDGRIRLTAKGPSGEEVALGELGAGASLGELSLLQQSHRMCTATASSPVKALELRYAEFQKLLAQKPQACLKLLMAITGQFGRRVAENRESFQQLLSRPGASPKG